MANILAVDDSPSMRQMITFTLKGAGYAVTEAEDGKDALAKAQSFKRRPGAHRRQHAEHGRPDARQGAAWTFDL
jgi:CheY-like chemotaxis protein